MPFTLKDLDTMIELGQIGIQNIIKYQKDALGDLNCLVGQEEV
jgi:hypothetical protein